MLYIKKINPFLANLGYSQDNSEIEYEKPISVGRSKTVFPDIVVNVNDIPAFVIDAKKQGENLRFYDKQAISYGLLLRVPYAILTDGNKLVLFDVQNDELLLDGDMECTPEILNLLHKDNLKKRITSKVEPENTNKIEEAKKTLIIFDDIRKFSDVLYNCENIIRDNDGLTNSDAFDEIAKILFVKIYYEKKEIKGCENELSRENLAKCRGGDYFKSYLFVEVKKNNPDIFFEEDSINLKDSTLLEILKILANYTLLSTSIDVKGRTFEIFLGRTFTGSLGQFFTPRTIVKFMVEVLFTLS